MPSRRNSLIAASLAVVGALIFATAPAYAAKQQATKACGGNTIASAGGLPVAAIPSQAICVNASLNAGKIGGGIKDGVECIVLHSCGSLLPTSPGDIVSGIGGKVVGDIAESAGETALNGMATWLGKGVTWLTKKIYTAIQKSTTPIVTAQWFRTQYQNMLALAVVIAIFTTLLATLSGVRQGRAGAFFRAALADLPTAFFITAVAVTVTQLLLLITDSLTMGFTQMFSKSVGSMVTDIVKFTSPAAGTAAGNPAVATPGTPVAITFLMTLVIGIGTFLIWVELIIREAAIYLALLFLPLGMMSAIHPAMASLRSRLLGLLGLVIGSKFVICFVFAFGAFAMAHAGKGTDGVTQVLAGAVTMLLAAAMPMIVLKMVSFDQIGDAHGHVPGTSDVNASTPSPTNLIRSSRSAFGGGSSGAGGEGGGMPGGGGAGGGGAPSAGGTGGGAAASGGAGAGAAAAGPLAAAVVAAQGGKAAAAHAISSSADVASSARPGAGAVVDAPTEVGPPPARDGASLPRPAHVAASESESGSAATTAAPRSPEPPRPEAARTSPPQESRPLPHMTRSPLGSHGGELPSV